MNKLLCIYHGNCVDGFAAAWVVRRAFGEECVEFVPGVYQTPPPDVTDREVVLVDFSYKRSVLLEMAAKARSILIIDHHKTAEEDLQDLPSNVTTIFDMDHSGCKLAWKHYFPKEWPPLLLDFIEDRDLWKFEFEASRNINAALFSYPYNFTIWDDLMEDYTTNRLREEGVAITRKHEKDIAELLTVATREMNIGGHRVPVANLPYTMASEAGHILAKRKPFAATYWDGPDGRHFSLRSDDEQGLDVSEIARHYGGGGHRNAAGFKISFEAAREFECPNR